MIDPLGGSLSDREGVCSVEESLDASGKGAAFVNVRDKSAMTAVITGEKTENFIVEERLFGMRSNKKEVLENEQQSLWGSDGSGSERERKEKEILPV